MMDYKIVAEMKLCSLLVSIPLPEPRLMAWVLLVYVLLKTTAPQETWKLAQRQDSQDQGAPGSTIIQGETPGSASLRSRSCTRTS
jgi:hypothetical protein